MYPTISSLCGEYEIAHLERLMEFWKDLQFNMIGYINNIETVSSPQSLFSREISFEVMWPRFKQEDDIRVLIFVLKENVHQNADIEKISQEFINISQADASYKKLVNIFVHPFANMSQDGHCDLPKDRYLFILDAVQNVDADKFDPPEYNQFDSRRRPNQPIGQKSGQTQFGAGMYNAAPGGPQAAAPKPKVDFMTARTQNQVQNQVQQAVIRKTLASQGQNQPQGIAPQFGNIGGPIGGPIGGSFGAGPVGLNGQPLPKVAINPYQSQQIGQPQFGGGPIPTITGGGIQPPFQQFGGGPIPTITGGGIQPPFQQFGGGPIPTITGGGIQPPFQQFGGGPPIQQSQYGQPGGFNPSATNQNIQPQFGPPGNFNPTQGGGITPQFQQQGQQGTQLPPNQQFGQQGTQLPPNQQFGQTQNNFGPPQVSGAPIQPTFAPQVTGIGPQFTPGVTNQGFNQPQFGNQGPPPFQGSQQGQVFAPNSSQDSQGNSALGNWTKPGSTIANDQLQPGQPGFNQ